ncbi:putative 1,4-dihydroxy-2-naphthoate polyprenyltransferase [Helianthus annuus]|nr:putative 1,4-dihydroxy-2-naphthoate polyprenyltransferase [Helianthus annuus]
MVPKFCTQTSWRPALHLQHTHNFTRCYAVASLLGGLKSSSWCCFSRRLYYKHIHIGGIEVHGERRRELVRLKSQPDEAAAHEDDISNATLVWRAIKLPIYSVALVPLTVSCSNLKES